MMLMALSLALAVPGALQAAGAEGAEARALQEDMWGEDVLALQEHLRGLGFSRVATTGYFGPETARAVRQIQKAVGLPDDAVVGPVTRRVIEELATPYAYRVAAGDTLWDVARRFAATMDAVMEANQLESSTLRPGQVLRIPSVRRLFVPVTSQLQAIAARLGVPGRTLASLNGLKLSDTIVAGSTIWTPLPAF